MPVYFKSYGFVFPTNNISICVTEYLKFFTEHEG